METKPTSESGILPYQDPSVSLAARVDDLLSRMTWEEKVAQLGSFLDPYIWRQFRDLAVQERVQLIQDLPVSDIVGKHGIGSISCVLRELPPRTAAAKANEIQRYTRENTRLGIPPIIHDEGLHGLLGNDGTSFPQSIAMASSWNPDMLKKVAIAIGKEARTRGIRQLLSPTINLARDPRCGRTEETYGEDPYLASQMAVAFIKGVQIHGVIATPKHYIANFVGDGGRDSYPIYFSEQLLREVYLPAFKASVREGGAVSMMAAYNSLNGLPCSCNPWLLTKVLRDEWGFDGFVVSDYFSVVHIQEKHAVAANRLEAAKKAVEAGLDVELPYTDCFGKPLLEGLQKGLISEEAVDQAVRRVVRAKFRLRLFDEPFVNGTEAEASCHTENHQALALQMAREAIVLLKNDDQTLPVHEDVSSIAVIGPLADEPALGGYSWDGYESERVVTTLVGVQNRAGTVASVQYASGCSLVGNSQEGFNTAVDAASHCDMAILVVGNTRETEGEHKDRADLALPGVQGELITEVAATGTPTVVVLINGSAIIMTPWINQVAAVVEAWYPGEKGGTAIAEVLFGDYNPGGKLPITIPRAVGQLPLFYNHAPSGRGDDYVDLTGSPLFPFGHGLSYTDFAYRSLEINPVKASTSQTVEVSLEIENTGDHPGDEVVQLYVRDVVASVVRPLKALKGFRRLHLKPGEATRLTLQLNVQQLGFYDVNMRYVVEPGEFDILVGSSSEDIRLAGKLYVV
ncbi:MAG: glycoside hydrolase family 3 N-terminal domain-containing protein [Anaerolineales bacterium]|jgi:beta-glucosidase